MNTEVAEECMWKKALIVIITNNHVLEGRRAVSASLYE